MQKKQKINDFLDRDAPSSVGLNEREIQIKAKSDPVAFLEFWRHLWSYVHSLLLRVCHEMIN